ncbi:hypothetical protein BDW62DRAFT_186923 [Aspergillus aurantiobrunneus]
MANTLDPRVDSDLSRSQYGAGTTGAGNQYTGTTSHGDTFGNSQYGSGATGYGNEYPSSTSHGNTYGTPTSGPHGSNLANKLDPRVDSDKGRSNYGSGVGATGVGNQHTRTGSQGSTFGNSSQYGAGGAGLGSEYAGTGTHHARDTTSTKTYEDSQYGTSTNAGPHSSNTMNKVDPRVDSDLDNRARYAPGTTSTGDQYTATSGNAGPHSSNLANKADPRVDSDRDTRAQYAPGTTTTSSNNAYTGAGHTGHSGHTAAAGTGGAGTGATHSGAATSHTGEKVHHSSLLNKLDPRVDNTTGTMKSSHGSSTGSNVGHQDNTYGSGGVGHNPTTPSNSADYAGQSRSTRTGESVGTGVKGAAAEIHGMGESLRGGMGAAVDKAFGHEEGVAKNDRIVQQGEHQMRSGNFHGH